MADSKIMTEESLSSLLNLKTFVQCNSSEVDDEIRDVNIEDDLPATLTCEPCKKVYLTKRGYDRHILRVHLTSDIQLSDKQLHELFLDSLKELSKDPCYPRDEQMKWSDYSFAPNPSLFSSIKKIYKKLKNSINAEKFYTDYYHQIFVNPTPFPGLDHQLSVELLRKTGDKILAQFQTSIRNIGDQMVTGDNVPPITLDEMEALEYLGGYVIANLEKKLKRKSNNKEYLEILNCFESDDVKDQVLVNLLNRGGLRGITFNSKNIFTKAEVEFRRYTASWKMQNIDVNAMIKNLMVDLEVTGNFYAATDHIDNLKEEVLLNVVESMLTVYLRVRCFSFVRDITVEKKKEKDEALKEKALRKSLKNKEKEKAMEADE